MANIKKIFRIKDFVDELSETKIDKETLLCFIGASVIETTILAALLFNDIKKIIGISLEPLNRLPITEKNLVSANIIRDSIVMGILSIILYFAIVFFVSFIIQKILKVFKRTIGFYKLINIFFYTEMIGVILNTFCFLIVFIFFSYLMPSFFTSQESMESYVLIPFNLTKILVFGLYIYLIKLSVKKVVAGP